MRNDPSFWASAHTFCRAARGSWRPSKRPCHSCSAAECWRTVILVRVSCVGQYHQAIPHLGISRTRWNDTTNEVKEVCCRYDVIQTIAGLLTLPERSSRRAKHTVMTALARRLA